MDRKLIDSISELQDREKKIQEDYYMSTPELKGKALEQMTELTRLRVEMFNTLKTHYERDLTESRDILEDEIATLNIVENGLRQSQRDLKKANQQYVNKMRMVEISTYFSEKYKAYNGLFKLIFLWMIPISILVAVGIKNPVSEKYVSKHNSNTIFLSLITIVSLVALYQILVRAYDLSIRNNMNFNEYNFGGSTEYDEAVAKASTSGRFENHYDDGNGVVAHDLNQFKNAAESLHLGCVDSDCCSDGTVYNTVKKRCMPSIDRHIANNRKAALVKGAMGLAGSEVERGHQNVESFSNDNVPFSSV